MSTDIDRLLAIGCFGLACIIGLAGAFVGLDTHGFWFDELFTARILDPNADHGAGLLSRIATDVHPPVYLVALSLYSTAFGAGDVALRSFSALSACAAILIFITGTRAAFSLPGRLFGAAMATGSLFWFFQAQNARSYGFCLMIGTAILGLCLSLLGDRPRREANLCLGGLIALATLGSFTHFYLMYVSVAALMMVALLQPRHRIVALATAAGLLLSTGLYVKLVVTPFSQVALGNNWYPNTLDWYLRVLRSCVQYTFGDAGLVALLLCLGAALYGRKVPGGTEPASRFPPRFPADPATLLLVGVPLLVLAAGIVSSTLLAPNFYDRNLLIVSPFLWGLSARLYDAATASAPRLVRIAVTGALGVITVSMASIAGLRLSTEDAPSLYEPFRQSAEWIRTLPQCRDQLVPVLSPDDPRWYKPSYAESIYVSGYGRYLSGYARPQLVFMADVAAHGLPADVKAELQQRLQGAGCPVLAWSAHNMDDDPRGTARGQLLASLDRSADGAAVTTRQFRDGSGGFVLYVTRQLP